MTCNHGKFTNIIPETQPVRRVLIITYYWSPSGGSAVLRRPVRPQHSGGFNKTAAAFSNFCMALQIFPFIFRQFLRLEK